MAAIISWQFMGWPASLKTCAAASRALRFLGCAVLSAAVRFLGLACPSASGLAGVGLWSGLAERAAFLGAGLVMVFFLVAMMHLLRKGVTNRASASAASPT